MVLVRLRLEGKAGIKYQQLIFDAFWKDTEGRILAKGVTNPFVLSREQKQLADHYYGFVIGLDEGLVDGDPVLADCLWRNLWSNKDNCTPQRLHSLVHYIKRELQSLDIMEGRLLFGGYVKFGELVPLGPIDPNSSIHMNNTVATPNHP